MRVKNRLSPYPILREFSDDYVKGAFESEITVDMDAGQLRVKVDLKLDSEYLKNAFGFRSGRYHRTLCSGG